VAKLNRYNNLPVEGKSRVARAIQELSNQRCDGALGLPSSECGRAHCMISPSEDQRHTRRDCNAERCRASAGATWRRADEDQGLRQGAGL